MDHPKPTPPPPDPSLRLVLACNADLQQPDDARPFTRIAAEARAEMYVVRSQHGRLLVFG